MHLQTKTRSKWAQRDVRHGSHAGLQVHKCVFFTPMTQHDSLPLFLYINLTSLLAVQTSVAVISPSKAKSVCSLSVCFHKQTKNRSKQQTKKTTRTQLVNPWKCNSSSTEIPIATNGTNGNALVVFCQLHVIRHYATEKVRKRTTERNKKSKWKNKQAKQTQRKFKPSVGHFDM